MATRYVAATVSICTISFLAQSTQAAGGSQPGPLRVLMLVGGQAHNYEQLPVKLAKKLQRSGMQVEISRNLADLSAEKMAPHDVICFNNCHSDKLSAEQQQAILGALKGGKGLIALHCALWSFQDWPVWRQILGGLVNKHDAFGPFEVAVVDPSNPIAAGVPGRFSITDEAYHVDELIENVRIIAQTAAKHGQRCSPEPVAWTNRLAGGRVFVLTLGHDDKAQESAEFQALLADGIRWVGGRLGPAIVLSELEKAQGFVPLFNGKDMDGWKYDPKLWRVRDGIMVGDSRPQGLPTNSYAIYPQQFGDFVLRYSVRFISGNSGVQFRSQELTDYQVAGYQEDVVPLGWGNLHEQDGRRKLVDGWTGKAEHAVNVKDWTEMEVICRGPHIILKSNGVVTADYTETDPNVPRSGIIALQLHRGDPMEVEFTNIRIKPL